MYIIIVIIFFEEGRNASCTVKGTPCPPGVWDSAARAALPTKTPSLSLDREIPPRNAIRHYFRVRTIFR